MIRSLLFIASILLLSCHPDQEQKFQTIIKNHLQNQAFKQGSTIEIKEFAIVKVDTISTADINVTLRGRALDKYDYYDEISTQYSKEFTDDSLKLLLYNRQKQKDLVSTTYAHLVDTHSKVKLYFDSAHYYLEAEKELEKSSKTIDKEPVLQVQTFLKAITTRNGIKGNRIDTLYFYIDKRDKIIDLNEELTALVKKR